MRRAEIPVRRGPGLAESRRFEWRGLPRMVDAPRLAEGEVLVSTRERAAVPDGAMPAALPGLRDAFGASGWTWEVGYSRAVVPPVLYADSAKGGRAGQVRRPAREVSTVTLRVRRPECHAYGAWTDRRWSGGGAVTVDGWRRLATQESFRALIE